jgi:two-component system, NtrC family, response regulator AtoC
VTHATILVVDDDERLRQTLSLLLRTAGHEVVAAADVAGAEEVLRGREVDLVISDVRMPGGSGLDLLESIRRLEADTPVILLTAYGSVASAVQAMQCGAFDYVLKPFDADELKLRVSRALALRRFRAENEFLRQAPAGEPGLDELIGVSSRLRQVVELARQVAESDASVLITGETGTGKEVLARSIHRRSARAERLLVPVNLAAVPLELLESELFGHARGSFTGAVSERAGKLELADGGTLFLDEVGDAPLALQPKLLRVLQDGVIERVGSNQRRTVDVRVISATNRDLEGQIAAGQFRSDLYYRLRVIQIEMPPLRDRPEDIRYLTAHFLRRFGRRRAGGPPGITQEALQLLEGYRWPGNVRELENVVERAVVLCRGDTIGATLLDLRERTADAPERGGLRLDEALDKVEREMILRALEETKHVKARAARLLGVSERSLWYKLKKHGLS